MTGRLVRLVVALLGLAAAAYGAVLLLPSVLARPWPLLGWLVAGPVLHDAVIAVVVACAAVLLRRVLPAPVATPVAVGLLLTGLLWMLAVPLLWRAYGQVPLPGLHDRPVLPGLLVGLAVIWGVVGLAAAYRHLRARARSRARS